MKYPVKLALGLFLTTSFWGCQKPATVSETPKTTPKEITIAFYNQENLFDTQNDPDKNDEEFLPSSELNWTKERYQHKLTNMASVIQKLGDADGPELLGVCEIENRKVLEDLAAQPSIKDRNYQVIHFEGPDVRSIDVALLYKPAVFTPLEQKNIAVTLLNPG